MGGAIYSSNVVRAIWRVNAAAFKLVSSDLLALKVCVTRIVIKCLKVYFRGASS